MNSFSHYAFGSVVEWMYEYMGGISPLKPGFSKVRIRPYTGQVLNGITTRYQSIHGERLTFWETSGNQLILNVAVPANASAN